jgi:UDP-glucose 4-epimerase
MARAEDLGRYFRVPADSRNLNYDMYFIEGQTSISQFDDYTSHNTRRLDIEQVKQILLGLAIVREAMDA